MLKSREIRELLREASESNKRKQHKRFRTVAQIQAHLRLVETIADVNDHDMVQWYDLVTTFAKVHTKPALTLGFYVHEDDLDYSFSDQVWHWLMDGQLYFPSEASTNNEIEATVAALLLVCRLRRVKRDDIRRIYEGTMPPIEILAKASR